MKIAPFMNVSSEKIRNLPETFAGVALFPHAGFLLIPLRKAEDILYTDLFYHIRLCFSRIFCGLFNEALINRYLILRQA